MRQIVTRKQLILLLNSYDDTAVFVKAVTMLWNCINVKSQNAWFLLNDENRKPFESVDDERFESTLQLAKTFKDMDVSKSRYSGRVMCLTADTSKALHLMLLGLVSLIILLLTKGFSYVLPGNFQSDRLKENLEFIDNLQKDVIIFLCSK